MTRRIVTPVVLLLCVLGLVAACGASAREKTLKATLMTTQAAQAGFEAWDAKHQLDVAESAASVDDGVTKLDAYRRARVTVVTAFEAVYRALAAAAILEEGELGAVTVAAAQLEQALRSVTKGKLP